MRRELVARTAGAWQLIWFKHAGAADAPEIDPRREMVLAVFVGRQPTGSYAVDIAGVTHEDGALVVRYRVRAEAAMPGTQLQHTPFQIIAVPAEGSAVRFLEIRELTR